MCNKILLINIRILSIKYNLSKSSMICSKKKLSQFRTILYTDVYSELKLWLLIVSRSLTIISRLCNPHLIMHAKQQCKIIQAFYMLVNHMFNSYIHYNTAISDILDKFRISKFYLLLRFNIFFSFFCNFFIFDFINFYN